MKIFRYLFYKFEHFEYHVLKLNDFLLRILTDPNTFLLNRTSNSRFCTIFLRTCLKLQWAFRLRWTGKKRGVQFPREDPPKKMWNWRVVVRNLNVIQKFIFSLIWLTFIEIKQNEFEEISMKMMNFTFGFFCVVYSPRLF